MRRKKKRNRRRDGHTLTIRIKGIFPFDRKTGMDMDAQTLETRFKERLYAAVGDALVSDIDVGFDQDTFDVEVTIR